MEHVAVTAGCLGQCPALGEPPVHLVIGDAGVYRALGHDEQRVGRVHLVADAAEQRHAVSSPLECFAERAGGAHQPLHRQRPLPWVVVAEPCQRLLQRGPDKLRLHPGRAHTDGACRLGSGDVVEPGRQLLRLAGEVERGARVQGMQDLAGRGESGDGDGRGGRVTHGAHSLDPFVRLAALPGDIPEAVQRGDQPPRGIDVPGADAVCQRGTQVGLLSGQPVEPASLVRGLQLPRRSFGEGEVVGGVALPCGGLGA